MFLSFTVNQQNIPRKKHACYASVKIYVLLFQITVSQISELFLNYDKRRRSETLLCK
jgi:hypothetical protein